MGQITDDAANETGDEIAITDDMSSEVRMRAALITIQEAIANRSFIDTAEIRSTIEAALD